jgi:hypothetical protein
MMADALMGRPRHITGLRVGREMERKSGVAVVPTIVAAPADGTDPEPPAR